MGGLLGKADANANAVVQKGAAQGIATVQSGAVQGTIQQGAIQGYAGVQSGAVQGNATIERGAAKATIEQGAFQGYAGVQQGAVQSYAAIQPGALQGTVEQGAVSGQANITGIERGGVVGVESGAIRGNFEFAPNAIQVNSDSIGMSLISLGVIAVAITALGGTTMYPWIFLAFVVVAGLIYAFIHQQRQALEAQIQSNRQITINFIYNQYQTVVENYTTMIKPYESCEDAGILDIVKDLKAEYDSTQRIYDEGIHRIQCSNDTSIFESIKNQFTSNSTLFQQNLMVKNKQIKQKMKEDEENQDKKHHARTDEENPLARPIKEKSTIAQSYVDSRLETKRAKSYVEKYLETKKASFQDLK